MRNPFDNLINLLDNSLLKYLHILSSCFIFAIPPITYVPY